MLDVKGIIILLTVWLIKKILLYKMSYFSKPNTHGKNKIDVVFTQQNLI